MLVSKARPPVVAEGPESALSIWQSCGYETWVVFGVSGWKSAPIPTDCEVILAPDSPAGRAFCNAVTHHLAEFGLVAPKGPASLKLLEQALAHSDTDLLAPVREMAVLYLDQIDRLIELIEQLADELRRLCTVPGVGPVIRLKANRVLQGKVAHLLKRPVGRPPNHVRRIYSDFEYQAASWDRLCRVIHC